ncbi:MAG: hypothetical protein ACOYL6_18940 [Bacteriovoracaceae bacterium]
MKNLGLLLMTLWCFSANAADNDSLSKIGKIRLKVKRNLYIEPHNEGTWLNSCFIKTDVKNYRRVISQGTILNINNVEHVDPSVPGNDPRNFTRLYVENKKAILKISCNLVGYSQAYEREMTISEFVKDMSPYMIVLINEPVELE